MDRDLAVLLEVPRQTDDLLRPVLHVDDETVDPGHEEVVRDVDRNRDNKRMAWAMGDLIENRPALSRWNPQYVEAFESFESE